MNWGNIFERAGWTFVEGVGGAFAGLSFADLLDLINVEGPAGVLIASFVGGVAALLSFLKTVAQERLKVLARELEEAEHLDSP